MNSSSENSPTETDAQESRRSVSYVYAARALRDFGDSFIAVLLPVYLVAIGLGALEIGVVATAALLGSALMTLGIRRSKLLLRSEL